MIIIFINVTSLHFPSVLRRNFVADERISLIGNTDASTKANYIESIPPLLYRTPSHPTLIYPPTHEITTADKTREMPSKGAYIYETFGKQMDKSNILEAKWLKPLEELMSEM